jgi:hypothetical protein
MLDVLIIPLADEAVAEEEEEEPEFLSERKDE